MLIQHMKPWTESYTSLAHPYETLYVAHYIWNCPGMFREEMKDNLKK